MTATDWISIARRIPKKLDDYNVSMLSAAVAFYCMLAVFPALTAVVTLYALIADPADVTRHLNAVGGILPSDVVSIFDDQLRTIIASSQQKLGLSFVVGLFFSLWSAHRGVLALIYAITIVYREIDQRSRIYLSIYSLMLTMGAMILLLSALFIVLALNPLLHFLPIPVWQSEVVSLLFWALLVLLLSGALTVLYRLSPPRRFAKWRWLSPGALIATFMWLATSVGFSLYVTHWGNYNETYGALGAAIVLLLWFFLASFSIIFGALCNAEMELQTVNDTTIGADRPLGKRGAVVADTVPPE